MKAISKYRITSRDFRAEMPIGAEVLGVQNQNGWLVLWAIVDPRADKETRVFRVYPTGSETLDDRPRKYVGTVQMLDGLDPIVWHVFDETLRAEFPGRDET